MLHEEISHDAEAALASMTPRRGRPRSQAVEFDLPAAGWQRQHAVRVRLLGYFPGPIAITCLISTSVRHPLIQVAADTVGRLAAFQMFKFDAVCELEARRDRSVPMDMVRITVSSATPAEKRPLPQTINRIHTARQAA